MTTMTRRLRRWNGQWWSKRRRRMRRRRIELSGQCFPGCSSSCSCCASVTTTTWNILCEFRPTLTGLRKTTHSTLSTWPLLKSDACSKWCVSKLAKSSSRWLTSSTKWWLYPAPKTRPVYARLPSSRICATWPIPSATLESGRPESLTNLKAKKNYSKSTKNVSWSFWMFLKATSLNLIGNCWSSLMYLSCYLSSSKTLRFSTFTTEMIWGSCCTMWNCRGKKSHVNFKMLWT